MKAPTADFVVGFNTSFRDSAPVPVESSTGCIVCMNVSIPAAPPVRHVVKIHVLKSVLC